jgi:hypothetical protein
MGLLSTAERWASFSDEWDRWLRADPCIRYFKMSEAAGLSGEFQYWREESRNEKVKRLASIIDKHQPTSIHCCVELQAFEDLIVSRWKRSDVAKLIQHSTWSQPYLFAVQTILYGICWEEMIFQGHRDRVEVIFDEHDLFSREAKLQYRHMRKNEVFEPVLPLEPWFRDDQDFMPLQAADFMAGAMRMGLDPNPKEWLSAAKTNVKSSQASQICGREGLKQWLWRIKHIRLVEHPELHEFAAPLLDDSGT